MWFIVGNKIYFRIKCISNLLQILKHELAQQSYHVLWDGANLPNIGMADMFSRYSFKSETYRRNASMSGISGNQWDKNTYRRILWLTTPLNPVLLGMGLTVSRAVIPGGHVLCASTAGKANATGPSCFFAVGTQALNRSRWSSEVSSV